MKNKENDLKNDDWNPHEFLSYMKEAINPLQIINDIVDAAVVGDLRMRHAPVNEKTSKEKITEMCIQKSLMDKQLTNISEYIIKNVELMKKIRNQEACWYMILAKIRCEYFHVYQDEDTLKYMVNVGIQNNTRQSIQIIPPRENMGVQLESYDIYKFWVKICHETPIEISKKEPPVIYKSNTVPKEDYGVDIFEKTPNNETQIGDFDGERIIKALKEIRASNCAIDSFKKLRSLAREKNIISISHDRNHYVIKYKNIYLFIGLEHKYPENMTTFEKWISKYIELYTCGQISIQHAELHGIENIVRYGCPFELLEKFKEHYQIE